MVVVAALGACGSKHRPADLGDLNEVILDLDGCSKSDNEMADERLAVGAWCTKLVEHRKCGCHVKVGFDTYPDTARISVIEVAIGNCRRREGVDATQEVLQSLAPHELYADLEHIEGPFHRTYGAVSADVTWSPDVFQVGIKQERQATESFRIVLRPKDGKPDKQAKLAQPIVTKPPSCDPRNEDMVAIPSGPIAAEPLRCPGESVTVVPAFTIDRQRVSCDAYRACISAGACADSTGAWTCSYDTAVTTVANASAYCRWRGAALPSWAQWQRAIRGPKSDRYPTGDAWLASEGCKNPTSQDPSTYKPNRCEHTNAYGVVYYVLDPDFVEWTSDTDCWSEQERAHRIPVAAATFDTGLSHHTTPVVDTYPGSFRCAR